MTFSVPAPSLRSHFVSTRGQRLLAPFLPLIYPLREMKRVSFDSLYFARYNTTLFKLPSFVTPLWKLELQLPIYRVPPDSTPRTVDVKAQRLVGAVDTPPTSAHASYGATAPCNPTVDRDRVVAG
jgi:hypothetical protein